MEIIRVFLSIAMLALPLSSGAENMPLSRDLIDSFIGVSKKIGQLGEQYPELRVNSQQLASKNQADMIERLKKSKAFPEIEIFLNDSPFGTLQELFDFSNRILDLAYFTRMNNFDGANLIQTEAILTANLNSLKANHASPELIAKAEQTLASLGSQLKLVKQSLQRISEQDRLFASQNLQWLKTKFSQ